MDTSLIKRLFPDVDPASISLIDVLADFHEGIMITDAEGVVLYMNAAQARIDDLDIDAAVGKKVTDLYRVDEGFSPTMACLKNGAAVKNLACYYRTHLGRVVNSIHNIYPITSGRQVIGAICYITDYRNIEHTFNTVMKLTPPRSVPTYGISQPVDAAKWTTDHIGQYNYYKDAGGYFQDCPEIYAELCELVTGGKPGRENADEITMAANLGLAMDDMAVAPLVFQLAVEKNIGTWLPL